MYIPATDNVVKGYEIANSLRFNDNDSAYLSRTPASAGNRKTWTWAGWVKRGNLSNGNNPTFFSAVTNSTNYIVCRFNSDDTIVIIDKNGGTNNLVLVTSAVFRDVSAHYHIVLSCDTTQATASDRFKLYINGEQVTSFSSTTYPSQNFDTYANYTHAHYVGSTIWAGQYLDGYLADVHFIDGQALGPENFGETGDYGEWKPIQYTGTYGSNGFYLDFEASGDLGNDVSGNGNDWTPTNLAATDQMLDTPTNNFAVLNVISKDASATFEEGNLQYNTPTGLDAAISTIAMSSGKWYCEMIHVSGAYEGMFGIQLASSDDHLTNYVGRTSEGWAYWGNDGTKYTNDSGSAYGASYAAGDIIGVALDCDAGTLTFYKNGVSQGQAFSGLTSEYVFAISEGSSGGSDVLMANFGQDSSFAGNKTAQGNTDDNGKGDFYYTPPSGYLALCTSNLPDATVVPSEHFNTVLYSGNGTSQSISGVGFQPDWTWIKARENTYNHRLFDVIRGSGECLFSDATLAEETSSTTLTSFDSDGFSVGSTLGVNRDLKTYVAWNWKANGAGVSNTDGSITSTVSANVDAGFSIVSYTGNGTGGATVGHGLSKKPELILTKGRTAATNWVSYSEEITANKYLLLNLTSAELTSAGAFNNTEPTASVFSVGTFGDINGNGTNFIAYAFHSVDGFSKFGSYTGNGSTDGPFIFTNFKPAFVIIKCTSTARSWLIQDTDRNEDNPTNTHLYPNSSAAEATDAAYYTTDHLSNGFKIRGTGNSHNTNGDTYIYMAFAESPFSNTNAR